MTAEQGKAFDLQFENVTTTSRLHDHDSTHYFKIKWSNKKNNYNTD